MPDAHFGYGATVGSVIPTQGAIIPSAVGVDIGCGMIAARLDLAADDLPDDLNPLHAAISAAIPAGVGQGHERTATIPDLPSTKGEKWWTDRLVKKAGAQFGSLGAGNHFVEVCLDELDRVWIVLHSGSRGVGNELANIHIDGAKNLMKRYFIDLPDPDLAYLVEGTAEFDSYIRDMLWAQKYAMGSRQRMMRLARDEIDRFMGRDVALVDVINCHHNFTEREHHMGQNVWLTRKGAIRAREGDRGVIPGSMGAASFIVSGVGNTPSFHSCSHGAGRRMSRGQARRELDEQTLIDTMAGKAWNNDAKTLLDEDPRAYKDIDEVMAAQADLVTIDHRLHQILNYKGA
jgi:tRNA-splicing ligase RtcB